jgi:hypothetical protein
MSTSNDESRSKSQLSGAGGGKKGRKEVTDADIIDQMESKIRASYQNFMEYA